MIPKEKYILLFFCKILEIIFDRKHKESDIDNLPILIVDGKGIITLDSFVEAIYEVFLLKK